MNIDYLKILITIILAVIGWIVEYYFTTRKDINQKRRDNSQLSGYLLIFRSVNINFHI